VFSDCGSVREGALIIAHLDNKAFHLCRRDYLIRLKNDETMRLLEEEEQSLRSEMVEAIGAICRSRLKYNRDVQIEGLIGVTIDHNEVILVSMKEALSCPVALDLASSKPQNEAPRPPAAHVKKHSLHWEPLKERNREEKDYSNTPLKIPKLDFIKGRTYSEVPDPLSKSRAEDEALDYIIVQPEPPEDEVEDLSAELQL
jgi:hypothetical protein